MLMMITVKIIIMIIITGIILIAHGNGNYSDDNIKKTDRNKKNEKHSSQYSCVYSNININMEKVMEKIDGTA